MPGSQPSPARPAPTPVAGSEPFSDSKVGIQVSTGVGACLASEWTSVRSEKYASRSRIAFELPRVFFHRIGRRILRIGAVDVVLHRQARPGLEFTMFVEHFHEIPGAGFVEIFESVRQRRRAATAHRVLKDLALLETSDRRLIIARRGT